MSCNQARCSDGWMKTAINSQASGHGLRGMSRGFFLSLDGLDGTGKSTQCRLLAHWLREQGNAVTECADPGGTAVGDGIRTLLPDHRQEMVLPCEALLFMASRAQLTDEVILLAIKCVRDV